MLDTSLGKGRGEGENLPLAVEKALGKSSKAKRQRLGGDPGGEFTENNVKLENYSIHFAN